VARRNGAPLCVPGGGQPYGLIAGRLFVPVEAAFFLPSPILNGDPPRGGYVAYVWHPRAGLVAFEESDRRSAADLLELRVPFRRLGACLVWRCFNTRLLAIDVAIPPTAHDILQGAAEISANGQAIHSTRPNTFRNRGADSDRYRLRGGLPFVAGSIGWVQQLSAGAGGAAGNKVERFAADLLQNSAALWNSRKQELERLMHACRKSGRRLEVCIGMGGDAPRGVAPPSSTVARKPGLQPLEF